ncbi:MAG: acyltransferase domain-containing protein, partial [Cyanobacteria bacterium J06649_11]
MRFQGIKSTNKRPKIAFLFTTENSEYINMGWELYQTQPTFKKAFDKCNEILKSLINLDLLTILRGNREQGTGNKDYTPIPNAQSPMPPSGSPLPSTEGTSARGWIHYAQFAIQYALYKLWTSWGVNPDVLIADGIGEYVAAT